MVGETGPEPFVPDVDGESLPVPVCVDWGAPYDDEEGD